MTIDKANSDTDKLIVWEIKFGQASVNSSLQCDKYGAVYPHEARMRNLTYHQVMSEYDSARVMIGIYTQQSGSRLSQETSFQVHMGR